MVEGLACWPVLYPDRPYDGPRFRKLCGDLVKWLEEYLAIQAMRKLPLERDLLLLSALADRKQDDLFLQTYRRIERKMTGKIPADPEDYLFRFKLTSTYHQFLNRHPATVSKMGPRYLQHLRESFGKNELLLDTLWMVEKLIIRLGNIAAYSQNPIPLPEISLDQPAEHVLLRLLLKANQLSEQASEEELTLLEEELYLAAPDLSDDMQRLLTSILFNLYSRLMARTGELKLASRMLDLLDWGVESGFLIAGGILPTPFYRNSITLSLRLRDHERAFRYLDDLNPFIAQEEREEVYLLNYAILLFDTGEFDKLIQEMPTYRLQNAFYEINIRTLILQTHYERDQEDEIWISEQLDTLIRYVRKQKGLPNLYQAGYIIRLRFFRQLVQAHTCKQVQRIQERIEAPQEVAFNSRWISEKLAVKAAHLC